MKSPAPKTAAVKGKPEEVAPSEGEESDAELTEAAAKDPTKAAFAKQVAKEQMTSVIWTTALGLPIVQPYRKIKRSQVMTNLQTVFISDPSQATAGELHD